NWSHCLAILRLLETLDVYFYRVSMLMTVWTKSAAVKTTRISLPVEARISAPMWPGCFVLVLLNLDRLMQSTNQVTMVTATHGDCHSAADVCSPQNDKPVSSQWQ